MIEEAADHILITADAVGGVWQYATGLAAELAGEGYRVTIAVMGPAPDAAQRRCLAGAPGVSVIETGLPLDWLCADAAEAAVAAAGLVRLVRQCGADIVHCNSPALIGAAAFPVPVIAGAHGCTATWWQAAKGPGPVDPAYHWHGDLMRHGLLAADAVIAPSASLAANLQATYRLPQLPLVVHNGCTPAPAPSAEAHRLHAALGIGRMWDPVKNAAVLDAAAALCDLRFLAAGPLRGPHGESAHFAHVVALGTLPGETLAELLALRPIVVSAATFEPFGLAVLEAAAAGCALVLSDIPTFRELWDGAAIFADPNDPASFAAAITRLETTPELRWQLGETAHARSLRFSTAATARAVMRLYRGLLAGREVAA